jgi:hypothetical protein
VHRNGSGVAWHARRLDSMPTSSSAFFTSPGTFSISSTSSAIHLTGSGHSTSQPLYFISSLARYFPRPWVCWSSILHYGSEIPTAYLSKEVAVPVSRPNRAFDPM